MSSVIHTAYSPAGRQVLLAVLNAADLKATFRFEAERLLMASGLPDSTIDTGHRPEAWSLVDEAEFDSEYGALVTTAQIRWELADADARNQAGDISEAVDHLVIDSAPVDWGRVEALARQLADLAAGRRVAEGRTPLA